MLTYLNSLLFNFLSKIIYFKNILITKILFYQTYTYIKNDKFIKNQIMIKEFKEFFYKFFIFIIIFLIIITIDYFFLSKIIINFYYQ